MGGCQNYGPFLGTLNIRGRIILGTQKGTIILTTTHITPVYTLLYYSSFHSIFHYPSITPVGDVDCRSKGSGRGIWGPQIRGTILGVPIIRTIVFWGLYIRVPAGVNQQAE